jgi:pSer/pThr/pTyr-binding forkhead associated (FHA) protein
MLIIRHKTGPLAGRQETPSPRQADRIVFGRDPAVADVVFPPDTGIVSRRHFALVRKLSGDWTVELFGEPAVFINGQPADLGAPVHNGATIELGRRGGPSFEVEIPEKEAEGEFVKTLPQEQIQGSHAAAAHAERSAARARHFALAGLVAAVVAGAAAGVF